MADDGLLVTISGGALSLLFYENVRAVGDQMGFFLGDVLTYVTRNVTDADRQIESTKLHIDIKGILPCSSTDLIHDSSGRVLPKKLKEFVKIKKQQIVGWYRFRPNTSLFPTVRDKILHKELSNFFNNPSTDDVFIVCMLNYDMTKLGGTHKFRQVFLHNKHGVYQPIPLKINNLGADASRHDGSDYKPTPTRRPNYEQDYFAQFLASLKFDFKQLSGIESVEMIQRAAGLQLDLLVSRVCQSDRDLAKLEGEVHGIQRILHTISMMRCQAMNNELNSPGEPHNVSNLTNENVKIEQLSKKELSSPKVSNDIWLKTGSSTPSNINNVCHKSESVKKASTNSVSYSRAAKKTQNSID